MAGFNLGDIFVTFKAKTDNLDNAVKNVKTKMDQVDDSTQKVNGSMTKMGAIIGAVSGVVSSVFNKAMQTVSNVVGDAIKRVDTLNNSARSFANMGFAVQDTKKAINDLDMSIRGLPTSLDSAVRGVTKIAAATNDIQKSQKIWSALNDAILGFGGTTDMVDNATVQLSQDLAGNRITAQTWLSLLNSGMGPTLAAIARQMGITVMALREGLSEGTISVETFTDSLIEMDTKGGGGMQSLQKIAKDSTAGMATGWQNAQTAMARGLASIINAIGSGNITKAITALGTAAEATFKAIAGLIKFIEQHKQVIATLAVIIGTLLLPKMIMVAVAAAAAGVASLIAGAQMLAGWLMALGPIGLIIAAIIAVTTAVIMNWKQISSVVGGIFKWIADRWKEVCKGFIDFFKPVGKFFSDVWQNIKDGFNNFVNFLKEWGPTILAIIFWPWALALGLIIMNWAGIKGFFTDLWNSIQAIWNGVVGFFKGIVDGVVNVFTPIIGFIAGIYIAEWNAIVAVWNGAVAFFAGIWNGIVTIFSPVVGWFTSIFQGAWNGITGIFGNLVNFFRWVWGGIVGIFHGVGTSVGNAISGAVRGTVNGVLSGAVGLINGFIGMINNVTGIINKIPGVKIGRIGTLGVPRFSTGVENFAGGLAYVHAGEVLMNLAPGTDVIPKKKVEQMGAGGRGIQVYGDINIDSPADADYFMQRIDRNAKLENMGLSPA
jgi:tape measure domain-containing protein